VVGPVSYILRSMRNVLITGTPRSGTTLLCSLLNKLPDTVALHEPMNVWEFPNCPDATAIADVIERFCGDTRKSLLEKGVAVSKHVGGLIPDNVAADQVNRSGTRLRHTEHGPVRIDKPLSEEFALAIKHPVAFTALLGTLSKRFECVAIVRNPLSMLASWNSLAWLNVRNGHAPIGEKLDRQLRQDLAEETDVFERQIHILEWFYKRFREFLPNDSILKYEDLIASHGRELRSFFPEAATLNENLVSKNVNKFYDKALMQELGEKLLARSSIIWDFYDKSDVEKLLAEVNSSA
jgi:sulfotransferase family protein